MSIKRAERSIGMLFPITIHGDGELKYSRYWEFDTESRCARFLDINGIPLEDWRQMYDTSFNFDTWIADNYYWWQATIDPDLLLDEGI